VHATYCTSCSSQAIGALTPTEAKKAASDESDGAYQDSVAEPLGPLPGDESAEQFEHLQDTEPDTTAIKTAVGKLRKIVRHVRSSPQRRQQWEKEAQSSPPTNSTGRVLYRGDFENFIYIQCKDFRW